MTLAPTSNGLNLRLILSGLIITGMTTAANASSEGDYAEPIYSLLSDWSAPTPALEYQIYASENSLDSPKSFSLNRSTNHFDLAKNAHTNYSTVLTKEGWAPDQSSTTYQWTTESHSLDGRAIRTVLGSDSQTGVWSESISPTRSFGSETTLNKHTLHATSDALRIADVRYCAEPVSIDCPQVLASNANAKSETLKTFINSVEHTGVALILEQSAYFKLVATMTPDKDIVYKIIDKNTSADPYEQELSLGAWKTFEQHGQTFITLSVPKGVGLTEPSQNAMELFIGEKDGKLVKGRITRTGETIKQVRTFNEKAFKDIVGAIDNRLLAGHTLTHEYNEDGDDSPSISSHDRSSSNRAISEATISNLTLSAPSISDVTTQEMDRWIDELLETRTARLSFHKSNLPI